MAAMENTGLPDRGRLAWLDALRGAGLIAMIGYHFSWDLTYFGLADLALFTHPFWLAARAGILSLFLAIAGLSLMLHERRADAVGQPLETRARAWTRRTLKIAAGAALITVASLFFAPDWPIYFGVLHFLAVFSLLVLPIRRWPPLALVALAATVLALDILAPEGNGYLIASWIGLGGVIQAVDFVPPFPWLAPLLAGMALGARMPLDWGGAVPAPRVLAWAGRHSLSVYLLHQPVLIGVLMTHATLVGSALPFDPG